MHLRNITTWSWQARFSGTTTQESIWDLNEISEWTMWISQCRAFWVERLKNKGYVACGCLKHHWRNQQNWAEWSWDEREEITEERQASQLVQWWSIHLPMQEKRVQSLGWEDHQEKGMATYSSILAWEIRGQRNLASYSPQGCRVRHSLVTEQPCETEERQGESDEGLGPY